MLTILDLLINGHRAYFKFDTQTVLLVSPTDTPPPIETSVPIWGVDLQEVSDKVDTILDQRDDDRCYFERGPRNEVIAIYPAKEEDPQLPLF